MNSNTRWTEFFFGWMLAVAIGFGAFTLPYGFGRPDPYSTLFVFAALTLIMWAYLSARRIWKDFRIGLLIGTFVVPLILLGMLTLAFVVTL